MNEEAAGRLHPSDFILHPSFLTAFSNALTVSFDSTGRSRGMLKPLAGSVDSPVAPPSAPADSIPAAAGRRTMNRLPRPGPSLWAAILPPWLSTIAYVIDRPKPVPERRPPSAGDVPVPRLSV